VFEQVDERYPDQSARVAGAVPGQAVMALVVGMLAIFAGEHNPRE
jgi:hypothetical protein